MFSCCIGTVSAFSRAVKQNLSLHACSSQMENVEWGVWVMQPRLLTKCVCEPCPRCLTREGINPDTSSSTRDTASCSQKRCRKAFIRLCCHSRWSVNLFDLVLSNPSWDIRGNCLGFGSGSSCLCCTPLVRGTGQLPWPCGGISAHLAHCCSQRSRGSQGLETCTSGPHVCHQLKAEKNWASLRKDRDKVRPRGSPAKGGE